MSVAIAVKSLTKRFYIQRNRSRTIRETLTRKLTGKFEPGKILWALHGVDFEVPPGRSLGIIGHNGAGKSTLLRLLCGIGRPTSGSIYRAGRVSGLLELGSGFHPMMTGRENIRTAGLLSGLRRKQVESLEREMIEFAELEEFIDEPVRTYSSGMYVRLAFASAIHMNPEILLIDEVLAVGDEAFRKKCLDRLYQFRKGGKTLIITSHVMEQIQALCDEVLVLEEGKVAIHSEPKTAIEHYKLLLRERTEKRASQLSSVSNTSAVEAQESSRNGTQEASIDDVRFFDQQGSRVESVTSGDALRIRLDISLRSPLPDLAVTLGIFTQADLKCFETVVPSVKGLIGSFGEQFSLECYFPELALQAGRYFVNVGVFPPNYDYIYDYRFQIFPLDVIGQVYNLSGIVSVNPSWSSQSQEKTLPSIQVL